MNGGITKLTDDILNRTIFYVPELSQTCRKFWALGRPFRDTIVGPSAPTKVKINEQKLYYQNMRRFLEDFKTLAESSKVDYTKSIRMRFLGNKNNCPAKTSEYIQRTLKLLPLFGNLQELALQFDYVKDITRLLTQMPCLRSLHLGVRIFTRMEEFVGMLTTHCPNLINVVVSVRVFEGESNVWDHIRFRQLNEFLNGLSKNVGRVRFVIFKYIIHFTSYKEEYCLVYERDAIALHVVGEQGKKNFIINLLSK